MMQLFTQTLILKLVLKKIEIKKNPQTKERHRQLTPGVVKN